MINSIVFIGLDCDLNLLPIEYRQSSFPQFAFSKWLIDQTHTSTLGYIINPSYFETRGEIGWHELTMITRYLKKTYPDCITIMDGKYSDMYRINQSYIISIFDELGFDAATVLPYIGHHELEPFFSRTDKGCLVFIRNTETDPDIQDENIDKSPLWLSIAKRVSSKWNYNQNCLIEVIDFNPPEILALRQAVDQLNIFICLPQLLDIPWTEVISNGSNQTGSGLFFQIGKEIVLSNNPQEILKSINSTINSYRQSLVHTPPPVKPKKFGLF